MKKALQKKFVTTAMLAVSLLIILLLGAINITNIIIVKNDINNTLNILSDSADEPFKLDKPDSAPFPERFPRNKENRLLAAEHFIVKTDSKGKIVFTDTDKTNSVDEEEIKKSTEQVLSQDKLTGKLEEYRYKISDSRFDEGKIIVFLNTSNEIYSYIRVLILSGTIGLLCWVCMLLFIIFLSAKAIRPIAENIEKQKQFITDAGHEIKTPLAIIQANAEALELYNGKNKWSNNIKQQVARLDSLTKNLLFLARSEEVSFSLNKSIFLLSDTLKQIAKDFSEPLSLRGIDLKLSVEENVQISADKEQIIKLISVLLDNALKYTSENGTVTISLYSRTDGVFIKTTNTVSALPAESPETMFERFYRADKSRAQSTGGYGIGLSVAKSIADANNADIFAEFNTDKTVSFTVKFKK